MAITAELKKPLRGIRRWVELQLPYRESPNKAIFDKLKQRCPDLLADVLAYTKLPENTAAKLISREIDSFTSEWNARSVKDDYWFYLSSKGYFWGNLAHVDFDCYIKLITELLPKSGRILEYGGGVGHISFALARAGYQAEHLELSTIQKDFIRFRAARNKVPVTVLNAWEGLPKNHYDAVLALDVFEHIPDAKRLITDQIGPAIKQGGYLVDVTEYGPTPKDPMHMTKDHEAPMLSALAEAGLSVVIKNCDYRVWQKKQ